MLIRLGRNPAEHVIREVLFTFDETGRVVCARDARTLEPATKEQVAAAVAAAPRFPKFFQVLPEEPAPAAAPAEHDPPASSSDGPAQGAKPKRPRTRRKRAEE